MRVIITLVNLELDDIAGIIDRMLVNHYKETFLGNP